MKRLLNAVLAVLLTLFQSPPLPRVIKHNLHPFMKRCYGKVVAGGGRIAGDRDGPGAVRRRNPGRNPGPRLDRAAMRAACFSPRGVR